MRRLKWVLSGFVALAMPATAGGGGYVLGDSIGEGVAIASGLKGLAHISVHIRGPKALAQIDATPPGSTVFVVLGTNDADGSIKNIEMSIDSLVEAAARKQLTMYWIGPHCVRAKFDSQARELDGILRQRLASTTVKYISMRDPALCSGNFYEPDGVHLKMAGYRYMWDKARTAVGYSTALVAGNPLQTAAPKSGTLETTGAIASLSAPPPAAQPRDRNRGVGSRLVMEIHTPPAVPSAPLVWVMSRD
jgi:hypothetical protein